MGSSRRIEFPTSSRGAAAGILYEWLRTGAFPDRLLEAQDGDRAFVTEVVLGVVRWFRLLEFYRDRLVARKPRIAADAFLLAGLYQVLFMDDVVEYAAVNETVADAKTALGQPLADFVNGVLRNALRQKVALGTMAAAQPEGVRFSHPDALVGRWERAFGRENMLRLCAWNNVRPETVVRINTSRTDMKAFLAALAASGMDARPHPRRPGDCAVLPRGARIDRLPGYGEGLFAVQDPSTLQAVDLLDPKPGESLLDVCAAPGGKTAAAADRMRGSGILVAADRAEARLGRLRDNLARLGHSFVSVRRADATSAKELKAEALHAGVAAFDAVLADVPCTNTGVLRRKPDARWRFSVERLSELNGTQRRVLDASASVVKPGGRLVYSTCSLEPEENERLVGGWLAERPDFQLRGESHVFPPDAGADGAYAALLMKT
jgi:16S rRNA (cytosine967-C5)-methyltransferase